MVRGTNAPKNEVRAALVAARRAVAAEARVAQPRLGPAGAAAPLDVARVVLLRAILLPGGLRRHPAGRVDRRRGAAAWPRPPDSVRRLVVHRRDAPRRPSAGRGR